jgi:hypothetical protein
VSLLDLKVKKPQNEGLKSVKYKPGADCAHIKSGFNEII